MRSDLCAISGQKKGSERKTHTHTYKHRGIQAPFNYGENREKLIKRRVIRSTEYTETSGNIYKFSLQTM